MTLTITPVTPTTTPVAPTTTSVSLNTGNSISVLDETMLQYNGKVDVVSQNSANSVYVRT